MAETRAPIVFSFKGFDQLDNAIKKLQTLKTLVNDVNKVGGTKTGGGDRAKQLTSQSNVLNQIEKTRDRINQLDVKGTRLAAIKGRLTRAEKAVRRGDLVAAKQILAASEKRITILSRESNANKKKLKDLRDQTRELERQRKSIEQATRSIRRRKIADKRRAMEESPGFRFAQFRRNRTASDRRIRRDTLSSAAIGGAFPLLFGQGAGASAGGALGGFAGGIIGGQAGFALSLVGTQLGSAVDNFVKGAASVGQALNPLTADLDALVTSLGFTGTAEAERIKLIEQAQGKQAALNAVTAQMNQVLGADAVQSLKRFGEASRLIGNNFSQALLKLQGALAPVLETIAKFVSKTTGAEQGEIDRLSKSRIGTDPEAVAIQRRIAELQARPSASRSGAIQGQIANLKAELEARKKILAEQKKEDILSSNKNKKLDIALDKIEKENKLFNATLDGRKEEFLIEQQIDQILKSMDLTEQQINETQRDRIRNAVKNNVELKKQVDFAKQVKDAFESLSKSINNDIKEGIKGLIKGTSTLADLLNNVADRFLDVALNQALFGSILGSEGKKGGGILGAIGLFANGGRPPVGRPSIVGEKGPELFVPSSSGTIVPNNKLGGGGSTSVVVNVDASGSDVQGDNAGAKELGGLISVAVQSELVKQQRPGGLLSSIR